MWNAFNMGFQSGIALDKHGKTIMTITEIQQKIESKISNLIRYKLRWANIKREKKGKFSLFMNYQSE